ncbi:hypothetical protein FKW77_007284 [Venturia effusa]|uniref:Uncharacterized protein n=1 Tax=Venturia effusa TaxID=50376 RepID=A0A517L7M5_9PEZI|nr:hypothetical protein FKW77_007284 [Venturia effusa]
MLSSNAQSSASRTVSLRLSHNIHGALDPPWLIQLLTFPWRNDENFEPFDRRNLCRFEKFDLLSWLLNNLDSLSLGNLRRLNHTFKDLLPDASLFNVVRITPRQRDPFNHLSKKDVCTIGDYCRDLRILFDADPTRTKPLNRGNDDGEDWRRILSCLPNTAKVTLRTTKGPGNEVHPRNISMLTQLFRQNFQNATFLQHLTVLRLVPVHVPYIVNFGSLGTDCNTEDWTVGKIWSQITELECQFYTQREGYKYEISWPQNLQILHRWLRGFQDNVKTLKFSWIAAEITPGRRPHPLAFERWLPRTNEFTESPLVWRSLTTLATGNVELHEDDADSEINLLTSRSPNVGRYYRLKYATDWEITDFAFEGHESQDWERFDRLANGRWVVPPGAERPQQLPSLRQSSRRQQMSPKYPSSQRSSTQRAGSELSKQYSIVSPASTSLASKGGPRRPSIYHIPLENSPSSRPSNTSRAGPEPFRDYSVDSAIAKPLALEKSHILPTVYHTAFGSSKTHRPDNTSRTGFNISEESSSYSPFSYSSSTIGLPAQTKNHVRTRDSPRITKHQNLGDSLSNPRAAKPQLRPIPKSIQLGDSGFEGQMANPHSQHQINRSSDGSGKGHERFSQRSPQSGRFGRSPSRLKFVFDHDDEEDEYPSFQQQPNQLIGGLREDSGVPPSNSPLPQGFGSPTRQAHGTLDTLEDCCSAEEQCLHARAQPVITSMTSFASCLREEPANFSDVSAGEYGNYHPPMGSSQSAKSVSSKYSTQTTAFPQTQSNLEPLRQDTPEAHEDPLINNGTLHRTYEQGRYVTTLSYEQITPRVCGKGNRRSNDAMASYDEFTANPFANDEQSQIESYASSGPSGQRSASSLENEATQPLANIEDQPSRWRSEIDTRESEPTTEYISPLLPEEYVALSKRNGTLPGLAPYQKAFISALPVINSQEQTKNQFNLEHPPPTTNTRFSAPESAHPSLPHGKKAKKAKRRHDSEPVPSVRGDDVTALSAKEAHRRSKENILKASYFPSSSAEASGSKKGFFRSVFQRRNSGESNASRKSERDSKASDVSGDSEKRRGLRERAKDVGKGVVEGGRAYGKFLGGLTGLR